MSLKFNMPKPIGILPRGQLFIWILMKFIYKLVIILNMFWWKKTNPPKSTSVLHVDRSKMYLATTFLGDLGVRALAVAHTKVLK